MTTFRKISSTVAVNGENFSVGVSFLSTPTEPYILVDEAGDNLLPFCRVSQATTPFIYGAGTRILSLWNTCQRQSGVSKIPVICLTHGQKGGVPHAASYLESASDPTLLFDPTSGRYVLFYWVNAWSPTQGADSGGSPPTVGSPPTIYYSSEGIGESVFPGVSPAFDPTDEDVDYRQDDTYSDLQPENEIYTTVRDVPEYSGDFGRIGPFDLTRFWVAPWSDAFLFQYNLDSGSGLGPEDWFFPRNEFAEYLREVFQKVPVTIPETGRDITGLSLAEAATVIDYDLAWGRLGKLSRCTRVLMYTYGDLRVLQARRENGEPIISPCAYLVVSPPRPILGLPRGINKTVVRKAKLTSFLDSGDVFITAALGYEYPTVCSTTLTVGNPQVDFTVHSPHHVFNDVNRAANLPDAVYTQTPPYHPQQTLLFPVGFPVSLAEALISAELGPNQA